MFDWRAIFPTENSWDAQGFLRERSERYKRFYQKKRQESFVDEEKTEPPKKIKPRRSKLPPDLSA